MHMAIAQNTICITFIAFEPLFIYNPLLRTDGNKDPTTLGTEKKSGAPYILTFRERHRQTPIAKHDKKTRHVEHST
jgi:hypothetical protein